MAFPGNSPPACTDGCCAPTGPASSGIASTPHSNPQNGLVTAQAMIPLVRGRFIISGSLGHIADPFQGPDRE